MNSENLNHFKPFCSVLIVICSLLAIVFFQMEERRLGYSLLKLNREHRFALEEKRDHEIKLAKITKPQLLDHVAQSRLTLKKLQSNQIIHLSGRVDNSSSGKEL
jgi:hypothetical protein